MMTNYKRYIICFFIFSIACSRTGVKKEDSIPLPEPMAFYYGYPSLVNGSGGNTDNAKSVLSRFSLIVLGDGLWDESHPDYKNTKEIVSYLVSKGKPVFGYIAIGVSHQNLPMDILKDKIDLWKKLGVSGIFADEFGYDFSVSRERQNEVIQAIRDKNLKLFVNAWNPEDVFEGENCLVREGDYYLNEAFLLGHNEYFPVRNWVEKMRKLKEYKSRFKIKCAALATIGEDFNLNSGDERFIYTWTAAILADMDYYQIADKFYGAQSSQLFLYDNPTPTLGDKWRGDFTTEQNSGLFKVLRETNSYILSIETDEKTYGRGSIMAR